MAAQVAQARQQCKRYLVLELTRMERNGVCQRLVKRAKVVATTFALRLDRVCHRAKATALVLMTKAMQHLNVFRCVFFYYYFLVFMYSAGDIGIDL
jgi:hypothetical protein